MILIDVATKSNNVEIFSTKRAKKHRIQIIVAVRFIVSSSDEQICTRIKIPTTKRVKRCRTATFLSIFLFNIKQNKQTRSRLVVVASWRSRWVAIAPQIRLHFFRLRNYRFLRWWWQSCKFVWNCRLNCKDLNKQNPPRQMRCERPRKQHNTTQNSPSTELPLRWATRGKSIWTICFAEMPLDFSLFSLNAITYMRFASRGRVFVSSPAELHWP